jgi:P27 family predicted phage terminase small subunit
MRGRKPHPTWRKRLDGNPGKRPINAAEPQLPAPAPTFDAVPPELTDDAAAVREWTRLAPIMRTRGQITDADRAALIALCLEWSRYLGALQKIATLGMVVKAPSGYPMQNPYLPIATKALAACSRLWPELGLTPSSRGRVKTNGGPDPFSEFDDPPPPSRRTH